MENYKDFKTAGTVEIYPEPISTGKGKSKTKMWYESITVDGKNFPYLKALKTGSECELKVKVKKTAERLSDQLQDGKSKTEEKITLEIQKISEPQGIPKNQKKYVIVKRT